MDKHEFQIKSEQIEKLYKNKDYEAAAQIADGVDWRKTRNVTLLTEVADIYENLERYEDCYEILNIAYDNSPIGRMIVYKMVEIAVKLEDFEEATALYKEYTRIAPHDLGRYVLKYKIYKGRGSSIEDQIAILEEYKSRDYLEQWAYELATLYYQQGMYSKCVEECDDLILWFSEGEYVIKAMELKMRIQPLTASQQEKYSQMVLEGKAKEIEVKPINTGIFNTQNLQAELAEGIKDYLDNDTGKKEASGETASAVRYPTMSLPDIASILEKTGKISLPEEYSDENISAEAGTAESVPDDGTAKADDNDGADAAKTDDGENPKNPKVITGGVDRETAKLPRFLGETDTGQLTFDMEENVLDRQITGQITIEDVLRDWEEKKKGHEAAIAEAAVREEKKREERRRLRETGQLPDPMSELKETVPEEIKRLIEEIENRIPVKVHVEPISGTAEIRDGAAREKDEAQGASAVSGGEPREETILPTVAEVPLEELPEILDILVEPSYDDAVEVLGILEEPEREDIEILEAEIGPLPVEEPTEELPEIQLFDEGLLTEPEPEELEIPDIGTVENEEEPGSPIGEPEPLKTKTEEIEDILKLEKPEPGQELKAESEAEAELADSIEALLSQGITRQESGGAAGGSSLEAGMPDELRRKEEEAPSQMLADLEKSLEETLATLQLGQLPEEEKKVFTYFTSVRGMNQQLVSLLEDSITVRPQRDDSLTGNIVITGRRGTGKSTLAADIVKAVQKQRGVKGSKMAKVTAESLDGKDVSLVVSKLGGGALLVERAGNMKTETATKLSYAMTRKTGGLIVILEDEKKEIDELFTRCESLGAKFTQTIDIPVFTNKELVTFGEAYALEKGCVLDEMAMLALYNKIGNRQTSDHLVNVAEVKEMIDEAISKGGKKGLFGKTKKSRRDETGNTILLEKDFED